MQGEVFTFGSPKSCGPSIWHQNQHHIKLSAARLKSRERLGESFGKKLMTAWGPGEVLIELHWHLEPNCRIRDNGSDAENT